MNNATASHMNKKRRLNFSGAKNVRDLGGYQNTDGKQIRWGVLYRSDGLHALTDADLRKLSALGLHHIIDFRSAFERELQPDRLTEELALRAVEIPILDNSTEVFRGSRDELVKKIKNIDAGHFLTQANIEFASRFTSEMQQFMRVLLSSNGRPVLFHCTAGKDRTGFASAILLRILGVAHDVVVEDYLLSNRYFFSAYRSRLLLLRVLRGRQFAAVIRGFMMAQPAYLSAAFEVIDRDHGSFENYIHHGLELTDADVEKLRTIYLE